MDKKPALDQRASAQNPTARAALAVGNLKAKAKKQRSQAQGTAPIPPVTKETSEQGPRWESAREPSAEELEDWAQSALGNEDQIYEAPSAHSGFPTNLSLERWLRSELEAMPHTGELKSSPGHTLQMDPREQGTKQENEEKSSGHKVEVSTIAQMVKRFRQQEPLSPEERKARLEKEMVDFHWIEDKPPDQQASEDAKLTSPHRMAFPFTYPVSPLEKYSTKVNFHQDMTPNWHSHSESALSLDESTSFYSREDITEEELDRRASMLLEHCEKVLGKQQVDTALPPLSPSYSAESDGVHSDISISSSPNQWLGNSSIQDVGSEQENTTGKHSSVGTDEAEDAIMRLRRRFGEACRPTSVLAENLSPLHTASPRWSVTTKLDSCKSPHSNTQEAGEKESIKEEEFSPPPSYSPRNTENVTSASQDILDPLGTSQSWSHLKTAEIGELSDLTARSWSPNEDDKAIQRIDPFRDRCNSEAKEQDVLFTGEKEPNPRIPSNGKPVRSPPNPQSFFCFRQVSGKTKKHGARLNSFSPTDLNILKVLSTQVVRQVLFSNMPVGESKREVPRSRRTLKESNKKVEIQGSIQRTEVARKKESTFKSFCFLSPINDSEFEKLAETNATTPQAESVFNDASLFLSFLTKFENDPVVKSLVTRIKVLESALKIKHKEQSMFAPTVHLN